MQMAAGGSCSFADATVRECERNRHENRPLARRAIERTLLLKGLEAEVAVITAPEEMDTRHLYVARRSWLSARLHTCLQPANSSITYPCSMGATSIRAALSTSKGRSANSFIGVLPPSQLFALTNQEAITSAVL